VDPATTHFVDIIVGIDTTNVVGGTRDCESVVMIRNLTKIDVNADHCELLGSLTGQCSEFRKSEAKGTARARSADVGTMFAIGTRIPYERKDPGTRDHSGSEGLARKCEHALTDRYMTYFGSFVVYLSLPIP
jgi:hypothetical protein